MSTSISLRIRKSYQNFPLLTVLFWGPGQKETWEYLGWRNRILEKLYGTVVKRAGSGARLLGSECINSVTFGVLLIIFMIPFSHQ